jgi:hypothetical protein
MPMPTPDRSHLNKYHRPLTIPYEGKTITVYVDGYDILALAKMRPDGTFQEALPHTAPIDHALKKLLYAGQRGHKGLVQDLREAVQAIERAIQMIEDGEAR